MAALISTEKIECASSRGKEEEETRLASCHAGSEMDVFITACSTAAVACTRVSCYAATWGLAVICK